MAVSKKTESSSFVFENEKFLGFRGVVSEEDLLSVDVSPDYYCESMNKLHVIFRGEFLLIPNLFYLIDVQKQTVCLSDVFNDTCFFLCICSIDIDELGE